MPVCGAFFVFDCLAKANWGFFFLFRQLKQTAMK
jgi:hypothetical protein